MKFFNPLFVIAALFCCISSNSQNLRFTENKGQWNSKVLYSADITGGKIFLLKTGYKILLNNEEDLKRISDYYSGHGGAGTPTEKSAANPGDLTLRSHAYEVKLLNASPKVKAVTEGEEEGYSNYFIGADASKWATGCKTSSSVTLKNVYDGVDIRYYESNGAFKYDFIIKPGGRADRIALFFDGVDALQLKENNLLVKTSVTDIKELKPYSYQQQNGRAREVKSEYVVSGNIVRFKLDNYNANEKLVIDPTLVFSTFVGSTTDNWGYCATYDAEENFYAGSINFGTGFPVSNGAFQTSYNGGSVNEDIPACDIGIMKFSKNGTHRLYATYLGGAGNEQPHAMRVNSKGELVVFGHTSSHNFPTTMDNYGPGGYRDIFIAILDETGSKLVASRKIGGSEYDGINIKPKYERPYQQGAISIQRNYDDDIRSDLLLDDAGNIYVGSCTRSSNFPVSANSLQNTAGSQQDAVLLKLKPDLSILFSTFLGGTGDDAIFSLAINPVNNNIYAAGATTSTLPGAVNSFQGGICDGFVAVIANDGSQIQHLAHFGTSGDDLVYKLAVDQLGYPYIMGTTTGSWPVINAAFSQANGKQFVTKLSADLASTQYSTVFGKGTSSPDISPTAFFVDGCENVYVAGWGGGINQGGGYPNAYTNGLSVTPDALQPTTDGSDFYLFGMESNAKSQLYGSFFGEKGGLGDHTDGGNSQFDENGTLYLGICANCDRGGLRGIFPTVPGNAWSPTNPAITGSRCNYAAVKFSFDLSGKCTLPVKIISFSASQQNTTTLLNWKTTSEKNVSYYSIERSADAKQFTPIGKVTAKTNSLTNSYSFTDASPLKGINYYRLNVIDHDGQQQYSMIRSVRYISSLTASINPNPVKNQLNLLLGSESNTKVTVNIVNVIGKTVLTKSLNLKPGQVNELLNVSRLSSGVYYLTVTSETQQIKLRFVK